MKSYNFFCKKTHLFTKNCNEKETQIVYQEPTKQHTSIFFRRRQETDGTYLFERWWMPETLRSFLTWSGDHLYDSRQNRRNQNIQKLSVFNVARSCHLHAPRQRQVRPQRKYIALCSFLVHQEMTANKIRN